MSNSNSNLDRSKSAFSRLHPKIQEELYSMGWTEIRPIQVEAINEVFDNNDNMIISAKTAGGKTEAVFLPTLSKLLESDEMGIQALYIGPLKALINDQFRRLDDLCRRTDIPVHKWHGDVGSSAKKEVISSPSGVLLITPESIEALFINKPDLLDNLFSKLRYIVIDELHSFMGTERGAHLKSLLCRISSRSKNKVRIFGLSATIGDIDLAGKWIRLNERDETHTIVDDHDTKSIKYRIHGYVIERDDETDSDNKEKGMEKTVLSGTQGRMVDDIYQAFKGKTALIFGNSKTKLEFYADKVMRKAESMKTPNHFGIHHGSLSKNIREDIESELRKNNILSIFCSSTLEMGIDVGNVVITGQIDTPWSVNSLVQRLGRSGRDEGQPSIMRMYIDQLAPDVNSDIHERLYLNLIEAVAMSELMLEGWCEPPDLTRLHVSGFVHQILSIIASSGGAPADMIFKQLVSSGPFKNIGKPFYVRILRSLGERDIIEQTPEGDLILGIDGEQIVRRYDFYSVFKTTEEYRVVSKGITIGGVGVTPSLVEGSHFILAGKRWKILNINTDKKEIAVQQSRGGRLPYFPGRAGCDTHPNIRKKMLEILFSDKEYLYLDDDSKKMLSYARQEAHNYDLMNNSFIQSGPHLHWLTWTGSWINKTLWVYCKHFGGLQVRDDDVGLTISNTTADKVKEILQEIMKHPPDKNEVAAKGEFKAMEKFDALLAKDLQSEIFVHNYLDLEGAHQFIKETVLD